MRASNFVHKLDRKMHPLKSVPRPLHVYQFWVQKGVHLNKGDGLAAAAARPHASQPLPPCPLASQLLPATAYDKDVDVDSQDPGINRVKKMVDPEYLPELVRRWQCITPQWGRDGMWDCGVRPSGRRSLPKRLWAAPVGYKKKCRWGDVCSHLQRSALRGHLLASGRPPAPLAIRGLWPPSAATPFDLAALLGLTNPLPPPCTS